MNRHDLHELVEVVPRVVVLVDRPFSGFSQIFIIHGYLLLHVRLARAEPGQLNSDAAVALRREVRVLLRENVRVVGPAVQED